MCLRCFLPGAGRVYKLTAENGNSSRNGGYGWLHAPPGSKVEMHCREFRRKHDAYIDDTLSGVEIEAMNTHRRLCEPCGQLDTRVRRALLLARNLPSIQPSPAFSKRLHERLDQERAAQQLVRNAPASPVAGLSMGTYSIVAAGLILAAGVAGLATRTPEQDVVRLTPVVATRPEAVPSSLSAPTMVAAMPAGMPLWPAVYVAQEAPWHFASDEAAR